MKNSFFLFLAMCALTLSCGPQIYKSASLEQSKQKVRSLAILPFKADIKVNKLPKGVTRESIKQNEKKTGYDMQNRVYMEFLYRMKKDDYTVKFQDIDRTNAILTENKLTYDDFFLKDKAEICKMLNVDAVLSGSVTMTKPMSEGEAIAIGILFGAWGTTNETHVSLNIHDMSGDLQWKFNHAASGSVGSSTERLSKSLMSIASRKFPYKK